MILHQHDESSLPYARTVLLFNMSNAFNIFLFHWLTTTAKLNDEESAIAATPMLSIDTRVEKECREFLPEVYDTWAFVQKLSTDTTRFREIYDLYKYERSKSQRREYFDRLKLLDDASYKLSLTIHQRLEGLERIAQPMVTEFRLSTNQEQPTTSYTPAYIRIVENQLNSLRIAFKRIITKYSSDSVEYQHDLTRSVRQSKSLLNSYERISRATIDKIQNLFSNDDDENPMIASAQSQEQLQADVMPIDLSEQEMQITDLEARLESVRVLKERVRQMK